jgi:hypothetical protein
MQCQYCSEDPAKFRLKKFPRLDSTYAVCGKCGRAQRRSTGLKTIGRGIRPEERARFKKALSIANARIKFKILVWGPAPGGGNAAAPKREQIRAELRKMGHEAFFSEEMTEQGTPTNIVELVQQKQVQLVINVAASYGSLAEFENYGILLGRRHLVFLNEAARGGFTDTGTRKLFRAAGGDDEFFNEADLDSCALALASIDWVQDKAHYELYLNELKEAAERESFFR